MLRSGRPRSRRLADAAREMRERLTSLALLLHELDEPSGTDVGATAPHASTWNEAGFWLERAEAAIAGRHAELERLTGWMTVDQRTVAAQPVVDRAVARRASMPWCDRALDAPGDPPAERAGSAR